MLGVEDLVHRGQADILVGAAVAGNEVLVEQFVIVGAWCLGQELEIAGAFGKRVDEIRVRHRSRDVVVIFGERQPGSRVVRVGGMRHVVDELDSGAYGEHLPPRAFRACPRCHIVG